MANLKGGTFDRQIKDIHHRLAAFGEGRHGKEDHLTHSSALSDKRAEYSRSFAEYAENKGYDGKLNDHMTDEKIKDFLDERTSNLSPKSAEDYTRGFSSMIEGLKEKNIDIAATKEVFNEKVSEIKEMPTPEKIDRTIEGLEQKIDNLYDKRFETGVIAEIQAETGLRLSEALKLANEPDKYLKDGKIEGMIGKGNHMYKEKDISNELIQKIEQIEKVPSNSTYRKDLAEQGIKSHDFRHNYAQKLYDEKILYQEDREVRLEISKELNHERAEITEHYLNRA